jgi:hypothetical protein
MISDDEIQAATDDALRLLIPPENVWETMGATGCKISKPLFRLVKSLPWMRHAFEPTERMGG